MQLFALYNHADEPSHSPRFYSLRVPLQVRREASGAIGEVHTHWLDHMTQHFSSGAQLVDGFFHPGERGGTYFLEQKKLGISAISSPTRT